MVNENAHVHLHVDAHINKQAQRGRQINRHTDRNTDTDTHTHLVTPKVYELTSGNPIANPHLHCMRDRLSLTSGWAAT